MRTLFAAAGGGLDQTGPGTVETFWHEDGGLHRAASLEVPAASFLAWHPNGRTLYAVNELAEGMVSQLEVDADGNLELVAQIGTGGDGPCHLAIGPAARCLFIANYGDGVVSSIRLRKSGDLDECVSTVQPHGSGPIKDRQAGPHAHMAVPTGTGLLAVVDLGTDTVRTYEVSDQGVLTLLSLWPVPPGTGPRQLVLFPSDPPPRIGHYSRTVIVGELNSMLLLIRGHQDGIRILDRQRTTVAPTGGPNFPAQVEITEDGTTVYVSNRGADVVTQFAVEGDTLRPIADYPCGGEWPRHFCTAGEYMYVANQKSNRIAVLRIDRHTGALTETDLSYDLGGPACVVPR
ncbi:MAG: lactonase family protein [Jatrophihabitans sp.]